MATFWHYIVAVVVCVTIQRISCEDLTEASQNVAESLERSKRAGLGLLQRLEKKKSSEKCEDIPCPRGFEFHTECNKTMDKKTLCVPCPYKHFKEDKSFAQCRPCSECAPGQTVSRWCTTKRNTLCSGDYVPPKVPRPYKTGKAKKSVIPNYIITLVVPAAILALVICASVGIYVRIKLKPKEKSVDKEPLTASCITDYEEAAPIPKKTPPPDTPLSVNVHPYTQNLSPAINAREKIQPLDYHLSFSLPKGVSDSERRMQRAQSLGTISGSMSKI